ncbi:hypothetical protein [Burkholderia sp. 3C]
MKNERAGKLRTPGRKPTVAFLSEENARDNILIKIELLERLISWCEKGDSIVPNIKNMVRAQGEVYIPKSIRQFEAWCDAKALCELMKEVPPKIRAIGNGTLGRHLPLKMRAKRAIDELYVLINASASEDGRNEKNKAKRMLAQAQRQIDILERELINMRMQMNNLMRERDSANHLHDNLKRHFREQLELARSQREGVKSAKISKLR